MISLVTAVVSDNVIQASVLHESCADSECECTARMLHCGSAVCSSERRVCEYAIPSYEATQDRKEKQKEAQIETPCSVKFAAQKFE